MDDWVKSGHGGEVTDRSFHAVPTVKPIWTLTPLPLSQVQPSIPTSHRGPARALTSYCLDVVSRCLDEYDPASFLGLPSGILQRVFRRLRADRGYDEWADQIVKRPDEATLWLYQALADPEGMQKQALTVGLPMTVVLDHLEPHETGARPEHPALSVSKLYAELHPTPRHELVTSIDLSGIHDLVDDTALFKLRWCTQLTILRTSKSRISDTGITLMASALDLPGSEGGEGKGMWRLRAWYMSGCKEIGDRSMRALARWPGLILLDIRDTSCTSAAIEIFNRASRQHFARANADFQPVTSGLENLFRWKRSSAELAHDLSLSLMPPRLPVESGSKPHIALHLTHSYTPLPFQWLPDPMPPESARARLERAPVGRYESSLSTTVYRTGGVGQIYGSRQAGLTKMKDEGRHFRLQLSTALRLQARDEAEAADPALKRKRERSEQLSFAARHKAKMKVRGIESGHKNHRGRLDAQLGGKVYNPTAENDLWGEETEGADMRSKAFYSGSEPSKTKKQGDQAPLADQADGENDEITGDRSLMMVRMVCEHWEKLEWVKVKQDVCENGLHSQAPQIKVVRRPEPIFDVLASSKAYNLASPSVASQAASQQASTAAACLSDIGKPPVGAASGKRRFGGTASVGVKRSGMKMFSAVKL